MKLNRNSLKGYPDKLIWIFIALYISVFSYLCFLKYYSFGYNWDFASDITVLWNSAHGGFLYYPFLEQIIFGAHLYLIILLILPVYAVFQHPLTLLFLQTAFLALAAYPLYRLAALKFNKTFALLMGLAYLLYPTLGFINLLETHFEVYEIFFLFFAIYYFEKENFRRFIIFIFLAIICKENVSLVVFMFGIYALLRRKPKKWILVPSLIGLVWFFLAVKVVIPYFAKDAELYQGGFIFSQYYKHLGNNFFDMTKTIITKPSWVFGYVFTERKLIYLFQLFAPTAFLGFLSPQALLIALPILLQNLLSAVDIHTDIHFHYNALLVPFIFYSAIGGFKKLLSFKIINNHRLVIYAGFIGVLSISGIYLKGPQFYLKEFINFYPRDELAREKEKLIKLIPEDASVIATFQFLPRLASRHKVYSMHLVASGFKMLTNVKYDPPGDLEYALVDFSEPLPAYAYSLARAHYNLFSFIETGNWKVVKAVDDMVLFKKGMPDADGIFDVVDKPKIQNIVNANINNQIILLGYDCNIKNDKMLRFTYYWKFLKYLDRPLGVSVQFLDSTNKVIFHKLHIFGYRIYAMGNWPKDKIFKENHNILAPFYVGKGIYGVRLGLFNLNDEKMLPVFDEEKIDEQGRLILNDICVE